MHPLLSSNNVLIKQQAIVVPLIFFEATKVFDAGDQEGNLPLSIYYLNIKEKQ